MDDQWSVQPTAELHLPSKSSFCCSKDTEGWHHASVAGTQEDWAARETEHVQVEVQLHLCRWVSGELCALFLNVYPCVLQMGHMGSRDSQMHWRKNWIRFTPRCSLWQWEEEWLQALFTLCVGGTHTRTLTHTAGFIYKLCFLLGMQQVHCLSLNWLELWMSAWVLWW